MDGLTPEYGMIRSADMLRESTSAEGSSEAPPHVSQFRHIIRVLFSRRIVVFSLAIILVLVIAAIFAAQLAPYDPYKPDPANARAKPSAEHWLGTDTLGRDCLSRMIYGSRTALMVGLVASAVAATIGITLGLIAGYYGRWVLAIIMRFIDALMAFPFLVTALVLAVLLGGGLHNIMIAVGFGLSFNSNIGLPK